jgi:transcriptional regulator with XRE-family HTH domain
MGARSEAKLISEQFGVRLQAARKQAGLTQEELSTVAECSIVTLSKLETGVNFPTLDILLSVAAALKTSPDRLIGWELAQAGELPTTKRANLHRLILATEELPDDWIELLIALAEKAGRR